jgi:hypothetical protein
MQCTRAHASLNNDVVSEGALETRSDRTLPFLLSPRQNTNDPAFQHIAEPQKQQISVSQII